MRRGTQHDIACFQRSQVTSGMSPSNNQSGCTLIVLAEWKGATDSSGPSLARGSTLCIDTTPRQATPPLGKPQNPSAGTRLVTSAIRRNTPSCLDSKIHHNNLLNNILAKVAPPRRRLLIQVNSLMNKTLECLGTYQFYMHP